MIGITGRKQTLCPLGRCIGIFFFTVPGRTDLIKSGHRYVLRHDGWEWETNKTQCHTLIHWLADSSPPKTTEVQSQLSNRNQAVRSCWALRFLHMLKQRDRQRCGRRDSQSLQSAVWCLSLNTVRQSWSKPLLQQNSVWRVAGHTERPHDKTAKALCSISQLCGRRSWTLLLQWIKAGKWGSEISSENVRKYLPYGYCWWNYTMTFNFP